MKGFSFFMHNRRPEAVITDSDRNSALIRAFTEPVKILLVDSRAEVRNAVSRFLNQFNVETSEATNTGEAIMQSEAHLPDIVFVHMSLPLPSDGVTCIKELKSRQPTIPVVAYDSTLSGDVGEAIRSVADEGIVPVPGEVALAEDFIHRILATFKLSRRAGMEA
jgi:CheY-like chemotaxis protein